MGSLWPFFSRLASVKANNPYSSNYTASQTTFDLSALITGLSRSYRTLLERLHAAGLRRFLLFGVPPVYRAPFGRQKSAEWRARSKKAVEAVNKVYAQTVREFGALHQDSVSFTCPVLFFPYFPIFFSSLANECI